MSSCPAALYKYVTRWFIEYVSSSTSRLLLLIYIIVYYSTHVWLVGHLLCWIAIATTDRVPHSNNQQKMDAQHRPLTYISPSYFSYWLSIYTAQTKRDDKPTSPILQFNRRYTDDVYIIQVDGAIILHRLESFVDWIGRRSVAFLCCCVNHWLYWEYVGTGHHQNQSVSTIRGWIM